MKALKMWSNIVLLSGIGSYIWGIVSGEFNQFNGWLFYSTREDGKRLLFFCVLCLLLGISLLLTIHAIKENSGR